MQALQSFKGSVLTASSFVSFRVAQEAWMTATLADAKSLRTDAFNFFDRVRPCPFGCGSCADLLRALRLRRRRLPTI